MKRRSFLSLASAVACARNLNAAPKARSKRERMMAWLAGENMTSYTPAAFFLHFGEGYENGSASAKRHLEFFRYTDMDFVKIQFEQTFRNGTLIRHARLRLTQTARRACSRHWVLQ